MVVAFRRRTLLPLDDCLYTLQATIPHLTRSALHRCLQRHRISRLPEMDGDKPARKKLKNNPIVYFHCVEIVGLERFSPCNRVFTYSSLLATLDLLRGYFHARPCRVSAP